MIIGHSTSREGVKRIMTEGIRSSSQTGVGAWSNRKSPLVSLWACPDWGKASLGWGRYHFLISEEFLDENRVNLGYHFNADFYFHEFKELVRKYGIEGVWSDYPIAYEIMSKVTVPPSKLTGIVVGNLNVKIPFYDEFSRLREEAGLEIPIYSLTEESRKSPGGWLSSPVKVITRIG